MESSNVLTASPLEEVDISRAAAFHEGASTVDRDRWAEGGRQQGQRVEDPFEDDSSESSSDDADDTTKRYPPRKDDDEETRRVEEVRPSAVPSLPLTHLQMNRPYDNGRNRNDNVGKLQGTQPHQSQRRRWSAMSPVVLAYSGPYDVRSMHLTAAEHTKSSGMQMKPCS